MIKQDKGTTRTKKKQAQVYVPQTQTLENSEQERLLSFFSRIDIDNFLTSLNYCYRMASLSQRIEGLDKEDIAHLEMFSIVIGCVEGIKQEYRRGGKE